MTVADYLQQWHRGRKIEATTLRGYDNYRFTDRNLVLASAESRWALLRDLDVAAFFDAGNVAARRGDLNLHKTSWGGGVRLHSGRSMLLREM